MQARIIIDNNIEIRLGDKLDDIENALSNEKIKYSIPYCKGDKENNKEIVMYINSYGIELKIRKNRIVYIRSSEYSYPIMSIKDEADAIGTLSDIIEKVSHEFKIDSHKIKVLKFDGEKYGCKLEVNNENNEIVILLGGMGNRIYIKAVWFKGCE